jgi:hypothetical protein
MKALQDFEYAGVAIQAGQEIPPGVFEADQIDSLLRKGLIIDDAPKPEKVEEEKEPVKKAQRSKTK